MIALVSAVYSIRQVRKQIGVQLDFERKRLEEKYLGQALYVIQDCLKASQYFIAAWPHDKERPIGGSRELSSDQRAARRDFMDTWRKFDCDLEASIAVCKAAEGESRLVTALSEAHRSSGVLFEILMEYPDRFESEVDIKSHGAAKNAEIAARKASVLIAERLTDLYKAHNPIVAADGWRRR